MSQPKGNVSRRTLFAGAGTVGAIAAAATVMPRVLQPTESVPAEAKPAPEKGGGYQLTEHVKRYYNTTRT